MSDSAVIRVCLAICLLAPSYVFSAENNEDVERMIAMLEAQKKLSQARMTTKTERTVTSYDQLEQEKQAELLRSRKQAAEYTALQQVDLRKQAEASAKQRAEAEKRAMKEEEKRHKDMEKNRTTQQKSKSREQGTPVYDERNDYAGYERSSYREKEPGELLYVRSQGVGTRAGVGEPGPWMEIGGLSKSGRYSSGNTGWRGSEGYGGHTSIGVRSTVIRLDD